MDPDENEPFRVIKQQPKVKQTTSAAQRPSGSSTDLQETKEAKNKNPSRSRTLFVRWKQHMRKWWWLHLIIGILLTLMIVLLVYVREVCNGNGDMNADSDRIYVGIRNIVQSRFNRATLSIISESVLDPMPNSFRLVLNTQFESHTSFTPSVEAFNASLSLPDSEIPFGYFLTPAAQAAPVFNVSIDQPVSVTNITEFSRYNVAILKNETVAVRIRGRTKVDLSGLPRYSVNYDKTVSQNGLNSLQGFAVLGAKVYSPPINNVSVITKIFLPNPSVLTVEMGNLTQNVFAQDGTFLGTSIVPDFTLRPGNNCFFAFSYIDTVKAASSLNGFSLALRIVGDSAINEQGQNLTYYSQALLSNVINYTLNLTTAIGADFGADCVAPS